MKYLFVFTTLLLCLSNQAESTKSINFSGQNGDVFELDLINTVTRYREEDRDTTYTRRSSDLKSAVTRPGTVKNAAKFLAVMFAILNMKHGVEQ